jgi:hypothetical protein
MTFNYNPSRMATVTISLRAASRGAKDLNAIREQFESQLRGGGGAPSIAGAVVDTVNRTGVYSAEVFFLSKPLASFGTDAGNVEFSLAFCNYDMDIARNL